MGFFSKNKNKLSIRKPQFIECFGENQYTQLILDELIRYQVNINNNSNVTIEQMFLKEFGTDYLIDILDNHTFKTLSHLFNLDTNTVIDQLQHYSVLSVSDTKDMLIEDNDLKNKSLRDNLFAKIRTIINNTPNTKPLLIILKIANKINISKKQEITFENKFENYVFDPNLISSSKSFSKKLNATYVMDKIELLKLINQKLISLYKTHKKQYFQIIVATDIDDKTTPPVLEDLKFAA
jgi:hypothetical protein